MTVTLITTTHVRHWLLVIVVFLCSQKSFALVQGSQSASNAQSQPVKLLEFEVASIKQNKSATDPFRLSFTQDGVKIQNASLLMIIRAAYGLFNSLDDKFIGVPNWAKQEKFDIEAKVNPIDAPAFQKLDFDHRQQMVRVLLADRFQLQTRPEMREQSVYNLVIARTGPKLVPAKIGDNTDPGGALQRRNGLITGENVVLSQVISTLTQTLGRTVLDKTDLAGKYDLKLIWTPDAGEGSNSSTEDASLHEASGPSIFTAIQEELGLKLESTRALVPVVVIEHVERPSAN